MPQIRFEPRVFNVVVRCPECGTETKVPVTIDQFIELRMGIQPNGEPGRLIQQIFPALKDEYREVLKTGICGECWKKIFPPEEDEE